MPPVIGFGDKNIVMAPLAFGCDKTVLIEGRPVGLQGRSQVFAHPGHTPKTPHPINPLLNGDKTVLSSGLPLGFLGTVDACLHPMTFSMNKTVLTKGAG